MSRRSGFSLVEMMVVIVIMGMLATAVAVGVRRYLDNGRKATVQMELRKLHDAVTQFEAETGKLPQSLDELVNPADGSAGFVTGDVRDPWKNPYLLILKKENRNFPFEVVCFGADGFEGGTGINRDISSLDLDSE